VNDAEPTMLLSAAVVFYPGSHLRKQIDSWRARHAGSRLVCSFARSAPGIRKALRGAGVALVDATEDPARALSAFSQAAARLGAYSVAVYTETMHARLELPVRMRGSWLLLGPLAERQWDGFWEVMWRSALPAAERAAKRPVRVADMEFSEVPTAGRLKSAGLRRPRTGVK
jgi:hypothetical protein